MSRTRRNPEPPPLPAPLTERERLIAAARKAAATVVPKATIDFLDGVRAGAEIVIKAIEEA